jgi:hypothetical protein
MFSIDTQDVQSVDSESREVESLRHGSQLQYKMMYFLRRSGRNKAMLPLPISTIVY